jgi:orotate phosphoribosyltransferase
MVGAPLKGRVVIIDDVLTSGTAIRQAIEILKTHPEAELVGIVQLVDRQERGTGARSTVQEVEEEFGVPVEAVLRMEDIMAYMEKQGMSEQLARMREHQKEYGIRKD